MLSARRMGNVEVHEGLLSSRTEHSNLIVAPNLDAGYSSWP